MMTRRALLAGLFAFFQKQKPKMAFTPHWIDNSALPDTPTFADAGGGARCESIVRDGATLWGVFFRPLTFSPSIAQAHFRLYKSLDAGLTWTYTGLNVGNVDPTDFGSGEFAGIQPHARTLFIHQGFIYFVGIRGGDNGDNSPYWSKFDLSNPTNPWTDWATLPFTANTDTGGSIPSFFCGSRPDGSILLALPVAPAFPNGVLIAKSTDGMVTWTTLGTLGTVTGFQSGIQVNMQSGLVHPTTGHAYLFVLTSDWTSGAQTGGDDLCVVVVSGADDSIGGFQTIQTAVVDWDFGGITMATVNGPGDISPDGNTICLPYGLKLEPGGGSSPTYKELKAAFGDLTVDPLNPTWSLTTIATSPNQMTSDWEKLTTMVQSAYFGSQLWTYWITPYPLTNVDALPQDYRLWRSSYVGGAWGTPQLWFDPATDSTVNGESFYPVTNFQLVKAFTNGVGIMLDVRQKYAAYDGPPFSVAVRNYASAGGTLAGPGNYAAA
jgi:hypothetical protein